MLKNYLKIAFRNMRKNKGYSFINIAGPAIGIACCVLLLLWAQDELSYDRFHENSDELYRILLDPLGASDTHEAVSPPILALKMKADFPEVVNAARMTTSGRVLLRYGERVFNQENGIYADKSFFEMFSFPFLKGDPSTALSDVNSIVITEQVAEKYFGDEDPIGKTLTINDQRDYMVTAVIKDVPLNSHLQFTYVRSFELLKEYRGKMENWGDVSYYTYVQLTKGSSPQEVDRKLKELIEREDSGHNMYYLQPLTKIHLFSNFNFDIGKHGNITYVYIFTASALFILIIACINFMNLATAKSGSRAKEIGLRKVIGGTRKSLIRQFYGESILLSFVALLFAVLLIELLLPLFNNLTDKKIGFDIFGNWQLLLSLIGIALFVGVLSGSYPALFLSSFQPVKIVKGVLESGKKGFKFRKTLVVLQFTLTIILLVGTLVVHSQINYIKNRDLGYDKDHLISILMRGDIRKQYDAFKNDLLRNPGVTDVTATSSLPTHIGAGTSGARWEGKDPSVRIQMQISWVEQDYLDTFKMEMASGRFFSKDFPADDSAFVLNEAAVNAMGIEEPLGKKFWMSRSGGPIIGVIKNFNYKSLHHKIEPLILTMDPRYFYYACIRIKSENISKTLAGLEETWNKFSPGFPFEFSFLDDRIDNLYRAEQRVAKVFNYFTFLAVFIACLGLFGLALYTAEQRTREIGVRKALGASVPSIVLLLSKEFTKWVLLSNLIAWPLAYFVMNQWLNNFSYRTSLSLGMFLFSAVLTFLIALTTVSYQSLKAALANPADSLRFE
jgi:ABC-type antimicrobial peptide transport system permease subunit